MAGRGIDIRCFRVALRMTSWGPSDRSPSIRADSASGFHKSNVNQERKTERKTERVEPVGNGLLSARNPENRQWRTMTGGHEADMEEVALEDKGVIREPHN